jgi:hypothetical protein
MFTPIPPANNKLCCLDIVDITTKIPPIETEFYLDIIVLQKYTPNRN